MSLPSSLSTLGTHALDTVRGAAGSLTWAPFVHFSKQSVLYLLQRVEVGDLVILEEQSGVERKFGTPGDKLAATLRVKSDAFWIRVFLFGDMVNLERMQRSQAGFAYRTI
jgi:cyclopropane-fatty-acyl-phospholipid synthase